MNDKCELVASVLPYGFSGYFNSECGGVVYFEDDGPVENGYKFCTYCGKPIEVKKEVD